MASSDSKTTPIKNIAKMTFLLNVLKLFATKKAKKENSKNLIIP